MEITPRVKKILDASKKLAEEYHHAEVTYMHLLATILDADDSFSMRVLSDIGQNPKALKKRLQDEYLSKVEKSALPSEAVKPSKDFTEILSESFRFAEHLKHTHVCIDHIFACIVSKDYPQELFGISKADLGPKIVEHLDNKASATKEEDSEVLEVDMTFPSVPMLDKFGENMNLKALKGEYGVLFGRSGELADLERVLNNKIKKSAIIIGDSGIGKTALIEGLAVSVALGDSSVLLNDKVIYNVDVNSVISGTKFRGEFEMRLKKIIKEASNPRIVLFLDNIHTIIGAGDNESLTDAATILKPALSRGDISVIGTTSFEQYRKNFSKDGELTRYFQNIDLNGLDAESLSELLTDKAREFGNFHRVELSEEIVDMSKSLCEVYLHTVNSPDREIHFLDSVASHTKVSKVVKPKALDALEAKVEELFYEYGDVEEIKEEKDELISKIELEYKKWGDKLGEAVFKATDSEVFEVLSKATGIPISNFKGDQNKKYLKLDKTLGKEVIGQSEAINSVHRCLVRYKGGIRDLKKPIGSFVFLGPTGVGKTLLAKTVAKEMFGSEGAIKIFDMSEYSEKHSVAKLIGAPPGYIGHDSGGQLIEFVTKKPYSVVLFDEIEKAHPDIFHLFLQILEEGKVTDSQGRVANFSNVLVVMTGNIGSRELVKNEKLGFGHSISEKEKVENATSHLKALVAPEVLGRIDEVVFFNALKEDDLKKIIKIELAKLSERCLSSGISFTRGKSVEEYVLKNISDSEFGARKIKKIIQNDIADPISFEVLRNSSAGKVSVNFSKKEGKIVVSSV